MKNEQDEQFQAESETKTGISDEQALKAEIETKISAESQQETETSTPVEDEKGLEPEPIQEISPEIIPDPKPQAKISTNSGKSRAKAENKPAAIEPKSTESAGRLTITVNFSGDEPDHLKKIIEARIEAGMTRDKAHFLRQCVDFAINSGHVFGKMKFSIPDNTPKLFLKDAYFNNKKSE